MEMVLMLHIFLDKASKRKHSVGCGPPACADRMCFNSHQMSALGVGWGCSSEQV